MSNREVAMQFLKYFCAGDVDGLAFLLTEDLQFRGPLYHFASKTSYIDSLKRDPPENASYQIVCITESADSVSIYYDYQKRDETVTIAQLFTFNDGRICEMLLVFNPGDLVR